MDLLIKNPASLKQADYQHHYCNGQKDVNQPAGGIGGYLFPKPQNQQNYE